MAKKREIEKRVENAILYNDGTILVSNVRASYAYVHTPQVQTFDDGKTVKRWKITGILPKKTHKAAATLISEQINKLIEDEKLGKLARDRKCLRDGDHEDEEQEAHQNAWTVACSDSKNRPRLRDEEGNALDEDDDAIYSGCWVSILFRLWAQNRKPTEGGKRINAGLIAVKKVRDDEPLAAGRFSDDDVDEAFGDDDEGFGGGKKKAAEDDDLGL